jgi:cellulose synthase (UDP-forming)
VTEDYFTGVNLSAKGYRLIYLDEKLSAGLATENISAYVTQRMRWARGTVQAFFIKSNPLSIPGLSLLQRLSHLEGLIYWFNYLGRAYFLVMPLTYSFIGVVPLRASSAELLYFFLPYYLVQFFVFSWLNYRSRSALLSDIYSLVLCFPIALTVIQVLLNPFAKGFKVTPKGTSSDRFTFNWTLASPMLVLFAATSISLWRNLGLALMHGAGTPAAEIASPVKGASLGWLWSSYNLLLIGVVLLILLDIPKPDLYEWFDLRRLVRLNVGDSTFWGVTTMISEVGAQVAITQAGLEVEPGETPRVTLEIMEERLELQAQIVDTGFSDRFPTVRVAFEQVSQNQHRRLVEMLFCRPGQWKHNQTPGELQSLWLLFRVLLAPRSVYYRSKEVSAIAVSQV